MTELPSWILEVWGGVLGAVIGSFLNVVIARVPKDESIVHPGSRCPRCGAGIAWYDNVPVLSWLLLRARCRACGAPIAWRYPLVELLGAGAGVMALHRHGLSAAALAELAFVAALLALAFIDLDTWLLPNPITWPLMIAAQAASAYGVSAAPSARSSALGLGLGAGAFLLVAVVGERLLKKEALGLGDVWLLGGIGAWLGAAGLLPVVLLASVQGAVVGGVLLALGRGEPGPSEPPAAATGPAEPPAPAAGAGPAAEDEDDWVPPRHAIPFGPFLALAALEWLYLAGPLARAIPVFAPFR